MAEVTHRPLLDILVEHVDISSDATSWPGGFDVAGRCAP